MAIIKSWFFWLSLLWLMPSCFLFRPAVEVAIDQQAEQLVEQGKQLLKARKYVEALDAFTMAADRDWHRASTISVYFAGLSGYYAGYEDVARNRFSTLIRRYPRSRYVGDAKYHLALMQLTQSRRGDQIQPLLDLMTLAEQTPDGELARSARQQIQHFLYEEATFSAEDWEELYAAAIPSFQIEVLEPWLYRQAQLNVDASYQAQARYQTHVSEGGTTSSFLDKVFAKLDETPPRVVFEPEIARIALVMPFYEDDQMAIYNQKLPQGGRIGLEFYEGFQIGVEEWASSTDKQVFLRTYDSRHDTNQVKMLLHRLDSLQPTVVVGDLFNRESRLLSTWAEAHQVAQVVPLSASQELVDTSLVTFLAHPSAYTHGARMAEYAWNSLALTRVSVFTDESPGTVDLAAGFMTTFNELGGTIDTLFIDGDYKLALEQIPDQVRRIVNDGTGVGVYIPLMGKEESAGLIINLLRQRNKEVVVMGSPHFRSRYNTLSRDIKERYELLFTTSHLVDVHSERYINFYNRYLQDYDLPPSEQAIQGYDLASYLLQVIDTYDPSMGLGFETFLRTAPNYEGLHIEYNFRSQQGNQQVNIGQYRLEGLVKVN